MNRLIQLALFLVWPLFAVLMLGVTALVLCACWLIIPFGKPAPEGDSWTLKFPWGEK